MEVGNGREMLKRYKNGGENDGFVIFSDRKGC